MTGAIWNLLLGLAWVVLSGEFTGLNLLVGLVFGYITLVLIEPQLDALKAGRPRQWSPWKWVMNTRVIRAVCTSASMS